MLPAARLSVFFGKAEMEDDKAISIWRMLAAFTLAPGRVGGGWPALAKLLIFCSGAAAVPSRACSACWCVTVYDRVYPSFLFLYCFIQRTSGTHVLYILFISLFIDMWDPSHVD